MRVLLVSGGTGGHISPALSVLDEMEGMDVDVSLVLGGLKVEMGVERADLVYPAGEITFRNLPKIAAGVVKTFGVVWKSDVILTFGGYPVVPPLLNAIILSKRYFLFEGDARPGKANRFFSPFARGVLCAFRTSVGFYKKGIFVGIPIRKGLERVDRRKARLGLGVETDLPVVGVMGGSQGSAFLNGLAERLVSTGRYYVVALVGKRGEEKRGDRYVFLKFQRDMSVFYSALDVIISRAGMSSIGEISKFAVPPLFIPYPFASAHQIHNALDVVNFGAGEMLLQEEANLPAVVEKLETLLSKGERYRERLKRYFVPDAARRISEWVMAEP